MYLHVNGRKSANHTRTQVSKCVKVNTLDNFNASEGLASIICTLYQSNNWQTIISIIMVLCFIATCNNSNRTKGNTLSFFSIPTDKAGLYYDISRRGDIGTKAAFVSHNHHKYRICSAHYKPEDLIRVGGRRRLMLKPTAVPLGRLEASIVTTTTHTTNQAPTTSTAPQVAMLTTKL